MLTTRHTHYCQVVEAAGVPVHKYLSDVEYLNYILVIYECRFTRTGKI